MTATPPRPLPHDNDRSAAADAPGIGRRRLLGIGAGTALAAGSALAWGGAPAWASGSGAASGTAPDATVGFGAGTGRWRARFTSPEAAYAPKFRWWWPNGQVDPGEIAKEVDAVADAGCGGLEVSDVHHSGLLTLDVAGHGWGSEPWLAGLDAALTQAVRRGITIDLTMGPSWPAATPTITPDSDAASCELAHGVATVSGGSAYSGPVPASSFAPSSGVTRQSLLAVHGVRATGAAVKGITPLDASSLVDLTSTVSGGQLTWTPPTADTWVLVSYWLRGSGQQPEAGPFTTPTAYVVDHFSAAGTKAVTDLWDSTILTPRIRRLLRGAGGAFFEDSLEIETSSTVWTPALVAEFRARKGYDVMPWLPILVQLKGKYQFTYDAATTSGVRDDLNAVLSDLYRENHLLTLRSWAHDLGMELRVQPYGLQTDSIDYAALLDIPESESLGFKNLDDYRVLCGGRDLAGHTKLSCESIAYANGAYSTTWHKALQTIGSFYAGGVNQTVVHGFAYADAPGATWPGFAAFSPYNQTGIGYSDAWGPRQPTWGHMPDIAGYMARTQFALQTGVQRYDLLFYRQKGYTATGIGAPWSTNSGIPTGWTHSFASDAVLTLPGVAVDKGRLAPAGPSFGALILGPDQFGGNICQISSQGAGVLLRFARDGLPVVLLGDWSAPVSTGKAGAAEDARVAAAVAQLLKEPTVVQVADQSQIPAALAQLGVREAVRYDTSSLMNVHRVDGAVDLFYLANARHAENRVISRIDQTAWLTPVDASAVPYRLDAWTGEISRIAQFTRQDGRIGVRVALDPGESTLVVLAAPGWAGEPGAAQVTATDADSVRLDGPAVVLRSATAGAYSATLADGSVLRGDVGALPDPIALDRWTLAAEDWQPGASATETLKPVVTVQLDGLLPWSQLPQLQDSSGVGRYTATVDLPDGWRGAAGAVLDLGSVSDTFRVRVNGHRVPPAGVLSTTVDLGSLLRPGRNVIEVEVATTLINRLRTVTPSIYGIAARQAYGLLGPVRLTPYGEARAR
ncbi:glycosyl hydrolase [Streptomyces sp. NPDC020917]|uniref:glycosyl hydrolase n=1 Tax=Streptomyces sp. NPDC020917 TaxID=3365102 RepID=UPI003798CDC7